MNTLFCVCDQPTRRVYHKVKLEAPGAKKTRGFSCFQVRRQRDQKAVLKRELGLQAAGEVASSRDWLGKGSLHKVGVFKVLSPSQAPAFWECPGSPEQGKHCPCLDFRKSFSALLCVRPPPHQ